MTAPDFWENPEAARTVIGELKTVKAVLDPLEAAQSRAEDVGVLIELVQEANDPASRAELDEALAGLEKAVADVELMTLLSGPDDGRDCFFNIQAGTGGADACDWAEMLLRMYLRYFELRGYEVEELGIRQGEEAGIQSCNLLVKGPYAYGYLSCETGVHRLVRISPFSAQGKRETSFASVDVQPQVDDVEVEIDWDKDVREDVFRASGAGGQHVNKTSSAIRITHLPTGIAVQCQNERSQHKNRAAARQMLMAKLHLMEEAKRDSELSKIYDAKGNIGWGNAIRSYFLYPEQRVKDSRTGELSHDSQGVLDGDIQAFIEAELRRKAAARLKSRV
jgi:peptide chain release factor 2